MASLPTSRAYGTSGPWSPAHLQAANNVGNGNTAPYAIGYLPSVGIQDPRIGSGGYSAPSGPSSQQVAAQRAAQQQAAAEQAAKNQARANIEGAIGRLDSQQNVGFGNINNAYQGGLQKLYGDKAATDRNYSTTRNQSTQDNIDARSQIDKNVGLQANNLRRLLGSRGAGNSSAARVAAPYAAALQGTEQRTGVAKSFNRNMQALDTNYQDYGRKYEDSVNDLGGQKYRQENALKADIGGKRASLLEQLQNLAPDPVRYQGQINSILDSLPGLANQYAAPIQARQVAYNSPDLMKYDVDAGDAAQIGADNAYEETIAPYLQVLLGQEKDQNGLLTGLA